MDAIKLLKFISVGVCFVCMLILMRKQSIWNGIQNIDVKKVSEIWFCAVLTFRLLNDVDERAAVTAATDLDEVFGVGDDVDGGDDGEPVRCLRRANALLSPSVLLCNLCTFTINFLRVLVCFVLLVGFLVLSTIGVWLWQHHYKSIYKFKTNKKHTVMSSLNILKKKSLNNSKFV